jgi:germination protein M
MKKIVSILIALSFVLSLTGCIGDKEKHVLYFACENNTGFSEEKVVIEKTDSTEKTARLITEALLKGPKKTENKRIIPENTGLIGLRVEGNVALVNLSQDFEKTKNNAQRLLSIYSLVNTLCLIEGINAVKISVNGRGIKYRSSDEEIGELSMNNVITADEIGRNMTVVLELYFASEDKKILRKEKRIVDIKDNETLEKTAVDQLLAGSDIKGNKNLIPPLAKLLSVETKDRLCYVNFSSEFLSIAESDAALSIYSVVNTLTSLPDISAVQIFINGEKTEKVGGILISSPLTYNASLVN